MGLVSISSLGGEINKGEGTVMGRERKGRIKYLRASYIAIILQVVCIDN